MIKKALASMALILMQLTVLAQTGTDVPMADGMRSNGKIYVVVAVILAIFLGIILYLFRLDRKISRLEKDINH